MVTAAEILPWILVAVGWTLAGVGIIVTVYFGLRARRNGERARRNGERAQRTEEKLDSLLRVIATVGEVIDMGGGSTAEVVMLSTERLGLNYTLVAETGRYELNGAPATLASSEKQQEEE